MGPMRGPLVVLGVAMVATLLAAPAQTPAALLWGHPYAMMYEADITSINYNKGWVFMWNANNPTIPYVGTAIMSQVSDLLGPPSFSEGTWHSLMQAMMNKKLTYVWTTGGTPVSVNDGSTGNLLAFAVTIFGSP